MTEATLIEYLPDPVLLLTSGGHTECANTLARDLAARHSLGLELETMFGGDVATVIERARRDGHAEHRLPLRAGGEDAVVYRVAIRRAGMNGGFTVVLTDARAESAARKELAERNRELVVLNDIGAALSSTVDLDSLAERIHEQAGRIMNTVNIYVAMHDTHAGTISFPVRIENHQRLSDMAPRLYANGLTEFVLRTQQPLLLNGDVLAQARALGLEPVGRPARSWMGAPLLAQGRAIGVIALQDIDGTGGYDQHDLEVLTVIAGQAAAAIRNAHLLAEARNAYRELSETQTSRLETERLRGITETVGALNHEVNNPLAAIVGNAQLMLRQPETLHGSVEDKVKRILEAARRIQTVTGRMANLIQATSKSYPGNEAILDVSLSLAREGHPLTPETGDDIGLDGAGRCARSAPGVSEVAEPR